MKLGQCLLNEGDPQLLPLGLRKEGERRHGPPRAGDGKAKAARAGKAKPLSLTPASPSAAMGDGEAAAARPSHQQLVRTRPRVTPFTTCSVFCLHSLIPLGEFNRMNVQEAWSCTLGCPGSQAGRGGCPPCKLTGPSFCFNLDLKTFNNGRGYRAHLEQLPFTRTPLQTKTNTPLVEEAA